MSESRIHLCDRCGVTPWRWVLALPGYDGRQGSPGARETLVCEPCGNAILGR